MFIVSKFIHEFKRTEKELFFTKKILKRQPRKVKKNQKNRLTPKSIIKDPPNGLANASTPVRRSTILESCASKMEFLKKKMWE